MTKLLTILLLSATTVIPSCKSSRSKLQESPLRPTTDWQPFRSASPASLGYLVDPHSGTVAVAACRDAKNLRLIQREYLSGQRPSLEAANCIMGPAGEGRLEEMERFYSETVSGLKYWNVD